MDLRALEKLREEELEEARAIQSTMLYAALAVGTLRGVYKTGTSPCRALELSGIPPGLFSVAEYENLTISLKPGDSMLFFTAGITDIADVCGEQFGIARRHSLCAKNPAASPRELLEKIFAAVGRFSGEREPEDDMAATAFHYSG